MTSEKVLCAIAGECSGCAWIDQSYSEQLEKKQSEMAEVLSNLGVQNISPKLHSHGIRAGRTRLDLTLETQDAVSKLGLYNLDREQGIVDMKACPMAHPELEAWLKQLRLERLPGVKKGSLRLRISPSGVPGLWIDFSNQDIKSLLDESHWLETVQKKSPNVIIEIGQRNKRLIKKEGRWKLGEPELFPWFETYLGQELKPQALYMPISGFTQTGFASNKLLIEVAQRFIEQTKAQEVLELFCGAGNFTLAMASRGLKVTAVELDAFAIEGLQRSVKEAELFDQIEVKRKDLYRMPKEELRSPVWFVDPPRSGLKSVLDRLFELDKDDRPRHLIYVSCFPKSWADDAKRLLEQGYKLNALEGVDQFPNTPHCEWISHFSL